MGQEFSHLWKTNKSLVIVGALGLLVVLYLVYKSATKSGAGSSTGSGTAADTTGAGSSTTNPTGGWGGGGFTLEDIHTGSAQSVVGPAGPAGPPGPTGAAGPKGKPAPKPVNKDPDNGPWHQAHPSGSNAKKTPAKQSHTTEDHNTSRVHSASGGVMQPGGGNAPKPIPIKTPARGVKPPIVRASS